MRRNAVKFGVEFRLRGHCLNAPGCDIVTWFAHWYCLDFLITRHESRGLLTKFRRFCCRVWLWFIVPLTCVDLFLSHHILDRITEFLYQTTFPILAVGDCLTLWFARWFRGCLNIGNRDCLVRFVYCWRDAWVWSRLDNSLRSHVRLNSHVFIIDWLDTYPFDLHELFCSSSVRVFPCNQTDSVLDRRHLEEEIILYCIPGSSLSLIHFRLELGMCRVSRVCCCWSFRMIIFFARCDSFW